MNTSPSTEERIWAILSHLSALAFGMGMLLPVIGWSEQRRKSRYASFHCLQALGYQSLGYTVWILTAVIVIIALVLAVMAKSVAEPTLDPREFAALWTGVLVGAMFLIFGVYAVLPVMAAIACGLGKDFHYPILGRRLAKYLGYESADSESEFLIEDHEDRWVAAMGHFSVIILLWGMLAPLTAWILQGKRSPFLKFQSIQTLVYQGFATLLYFGSAVLYMFGFTAFIALTGFEAARDTTSSTSIVGLVILIVSMIIAMLIVLIMPLLHILGQWAGYRVLKGDDYRYPVVGRLVERRIAKPAGVQKLAPANETP